MSLTGLLEQLFPGTSSRGLPEQAANYASGLQGFRRHVDSREQLGEGERGKLHLVLTRDG